MQRSEGEGTKRILRGTLIILATVVTGVFASGSLFVELLVAGFSEQSVSGVYSLLLIVGVVLGLIAGVIQLISGVALRDEEARLRHQAASQEAPPGDPESR